MTRNEFKRTEKAIKLAGIEFKKDPQKAHLFLLKTGLFNKNSQLKKFYKKEDI